MELFVSDLDGTLLNSNKEISHYSKEGLNNLIQRGIDFTVATARTPATVVDILKDIDIKIPVVLMNGVIIYNIENDEYIKVEEVDSKTTKMVLEIFLSKNKNPLVYGINDNKLVVYHKEFTCEVEEKFYEERKNSPYKTFANVEEYLDIVKESSIINFITFDKLEVIEELYNEIIKIPGVTANYYEEIYDRGWYFLEVYSSRASKANGIKEIYKYVDSNKLICFGDNVNDIPMFQVADECYAVKNSDERLKAIATRVIGDNNEDSVVKYILDRF